MRGLTRFSSSRGAPSARCLCHLPAPAQSPLFMCTTSTICRHGLHLCSSQKCPCCGSESLQVHKHPVLGCMEREGSTAYVAYVILMSPLSSAPSTSAGRRVQICRSGDYNRLAHRATTLFQKRLCLLHPAVLILPAPACTASEQDVLRSDNGLRASAL